MKRNLIYGVAICALFTMASCGSKESAYRKAYEKAKAQEAVQTIEQTPETNVVTPLETRPATQTQTIDNADNVSVRQESVSVVNGSGLKNFSVVVGSFGLKANAENLQQRLKNEGYDAQIVYNADRNMYRVVSSTFETKYDAAVSREKFRQTFPDAWLLYNK